MSSNSERMIRSGASKTLLVSVAIAVSCRAYDWPTTTDRGPLEGEAGAHPNGGDDATVTGQESGGRSGAMPSGAGRGDGGKPGSSGTGGKGHSGGGRDSTPSGGSGSGDGGSNDPGFAGVAHSGQGGESGEGSASGAGGSGAGGSGAGGSSAGAAGTEEPGGAGGEGGGWSPLSEPNLVLWLAASPTDVELDERTWVSRWKDRSAREHDAVSDPRVPGPTLVAGATNGRWGLSFDQAKLAVKDNTDLQLGVLDFTLAIVASWTNPPEVLERPGQPGNWGYGILLSKQEYDYPYVGLGLFTNVGQVGVNEQLTALGVQLAVDDQFYGMPTGHNDGNLRYYRVCRNQGTAITIQVNGGEIFTDSVPPDRDISAVGRNLVFGGSGTINDYLLGVIAEVVLFRGEVSDDTLHNLDHFVQDRYRFATAARRH